MGLTRRIAYLVPLIGAVLVGGVRAAPDIVIANFEGPDYGAWTAEGTAFGPGPAHGTLAGQMAVSGFQGHGLVNTYFGGDGSTGTLTSPPFRIERRFIHFLIGGGMHPGETCMDLLVGGEVVRTATGPNDRPGGTERLDWHTWDVADLLGKEAVLRIVDKATGGWGHINIDYIIASDDRVKGWTMRLLVHKRYLNLPVRTGAPMRRLQVVDGETVVREFDIELVGRDPALCAFLDLTPYQGRELTLRVPGYGEEDLFAGVTQTDEIAGAEDLYREPLRPQFHFSSRRGWNNDPNGLVYLDGEYHLFYQHNPYGWNWGNMHWGHAVSRDLVHWEELGDALFPDEHGTCFSGSAVVDERNTTGFGAAGQTPLVCIYTAAGDPFTQCLAYSLDRGRTWTKYKGNPVLPHIVGANRDPKVIWHEPSGKWVMALYLDGSDYALFSSSDLRKWERLCDVSIPGTSECPEFFEIAVDGDQGNRKWVFYGGNGRYLIGSFDGHTYTVESGPHDLNRGNCFYASQTLNGIPAEDGRRILIAWGQVTMPGMPFNQMMDFPVELTLRTTAEGLRLFAVPAREIAKLHGKAYSWHDTVLEPEANPLADVRGQLFHVRADLRPTGATQVWFYARGIPIVYDVARQVVECLGREAPLPLDGGRLRLELLIDRTSIEIFGADGQLYMPMGVLLDPESRSVGLYARGGGAHVESLDVWELHGAW